MLSEQDFEMRKKATVLMQLHLL